MNPLKFFTTPTADDLRADQLADAERLAVHHQAAAEHHFALATMYQSRVARLKSTAQQNGHGRDFTIHA